MLMNHKLFYIDFMYIISNNEGGYFYLVVTGNDL